ncbi:MAG: hypothetical protein MRERV_13c037 [Mycoplasmataceae bacterium RV_VA103A]|nr:MAG: hypothetical protein MRERV_13c037 [Mycoplasmataceae bacterium RV_VA103A]
MPIRKRKVNKVSQNQKGRVTSLVRQKVKPQLSGKFHGSRRLIKNLSFANLEKLIHQAQQSKQKPLFKKFRSLYRQKLSAWATAWQQGRQKLLANQQKRRQRKQAALRVQQAKQAAKHQKKQRLKQIYSYFQKELNKQDPKQSPYFTPHLDLPPHLSLYVKKLQRQHPDYNPWKEFGSKYTTYRLNKAGSNYLLKQTNQAYQEELKSESNQIRYWQEKAGLTKVHPKQLLKRGQKIKLFFPEKGEHKDFYRKKKEFKELWQEILTREGSIQGRIRVSELSKQLYLKSPWRLRDRFLIPTNQPPKSFGFEDIWTKYYKNNPFTHTRKYYLKAWQKMWIRTAPRGEEVPEEEIELDRYGMPKIKAGQVIRLDSNKPGRMWSVWRKVPSLEEVMKEELHDEAHRGYMEEYGSELEIQTWRLKKDKALCWVEAMGMGSCKENQGTSNWWCLDCINYGEYHPPVLPKHCPWLYSYRPGVCGRMEHADANKQWHFSVEGERRRDKIKGGDWGGCHIGTFSKPRKERDKPRRKKYTYKK